MRYARGRGPNTLHRSKIKKPAQGKDAAAVSLGKRGGVVGGPARARALSGAKRSAIAKHSANRRWNNRTSYSKPAFYLRKVR